MVRVESRPDAAARTPSVGAVQPELPSERPLARRAASRLVKFAMVGASGVVVTLVMNYILHGILEIPLPLSTPLAVETAIITNFIGNNLWTFRGRDPRERTWQRGETHPLLGPVIHWILQPTVRRFVKFNAVSLVGLVITTVITTYVAATYQAELRAIAGSNYFLIANFAGICVAMSWNFLVNAFWTWR